ncbi:MAG: hypothetical protein BRD37_06750 [Bacteroidetes bacterium QH_8_67_23]|nr:MAG: hypothetical protein BRD37_06750 [Bacteroidetes bacterium QH_8_67_23]
MTEGVEYGFFVREHDDAHVLLDSEKVAPEAQAPVVLHLGRTSFCRAVSTCSSEMPCTCFRRSTYEVACKGIGVGFALPEA